MTNFKDIQRRLKLLTENRNFYFKDTTRIAAKKYLESKTIFSGLSDFEILSLEMGLKRSFPTDFKQYLSVFGKNCGDLFYCGQDIETDKFIDYQEWAAKLIEKKNIKPFLTDNSIVFLFHQGYSFYYFDEKGVVYGYTEGDIEPNKVYDSFNALLHAELGQMEKLNKDCKESDGYFISINNGHQTMEWPAMDSGIIPRIVGDKFIDENEKGLLAY